MYIVPVGTTQAMSIKVAVSMAGGLPGAGTKWGVNIGGVVEVFGEYIVDFPTTGDITDIVTIEDNSLVYHAADTGATSTSISVDWTEQRVLTPRGEERTVVGNITGTANGASITVPPRVVNGLNVPPGLWVTGNTLYQHTEKTGTTSMTCSQCGLSGGETLSLMPYSHFNDDRNVYFKNNGGLGTLAGDGWYYELKGWACYGIGDWSGTSGSLETVNPGGSFSPLPIPADAITYTTINGHIAVAPPTLSIGTTFYDTGGDYDGIGLGGDFTEQPWQLLSLVAKESITVTSQAVNWPAMSPVVGVPITVWNGTWNPLTPETQCDDRLNPFQVAPHGFKFTAAPAHTDKLGLGPTVALTALGFGSGVDSTLETGSVDCFVNACIGQDSRGENSATFPTSPPAPNNDLHYLYRHNLDPRGPIAETAPFDPDDPPWLTGGPGYQSAAMIDMWTSDTLLTVTRATSLLIDDGSDPTKWNPVEFVTTPTTDVTVAAGGSGGVAFTRTAGGTGPTGMSRKLDGGDAGLRRAFRQFRYLRVQMNAPVKSTIKLSLHSNILGTGVASSALVSYNVKLAAGDNDMTFDLAALLPLIDNIISHNPAEPFIGGSVNGPDGIGRWSLADDDTSGHTSSFYLTPNPTITTAHYAWQNADAWWIFFSDLPLGVTFTLAELTCMDRTDGKRTALRVLGDPGALQRFTVAGDGSAQPDSGYRYVLQVLANGRPVAGFPAFWNEGPTVVDDLIARWGDTIDGGAGIWSFVNHDTALTAVIPPHWLEVVPGSVTETGFSLRARAMYWGGTLAPCVHPGWAAFVGYQIKAWFRWGGEFVGIAIDGNTRKPIVGALSAEFTYPPTATTPQRDVGICDDDGYFEIRQRQPVSTSGGLLCGKTFDVLTGNGGIDALTFTVLDANALHLTVLTHPKIPSVPATLAPADGSFHKVERVFYSLLGSAVVGKDGLAYRGNYAGAPRRWHSFAWDIGPVTITPSLIADNPCIAKRADGRLYVAWDEETKDNPREADSWVSYSDDDGRSWSDPTMMVASGEYPRIETGHDASTYYIAWVDDGSNQGIGTLQGQFRYLGDISPSSPTTLRKLDDDGNLVPIVVQQAKYSLKHLAESASRWILSVVEPGGTSSIEYVSADDAGMTFVRQGTATAGMDIGPGGKMAYTAFAYEDSSDVPTTGVQTVGTLTTGDNQTVILNAQSDPKDNGFWVTSSTAAWSRPAWMASGKTVQPGEALAFVAPGGTNGGVLVNATNTANFVVDTDAQTWGLTVAATPSITYQEDTFNAPIASATGIGPLTYTPNGVDMEVYFDAKKLRQSQFTWPGTGGSMYIDLAGGFDLTQIVDGLIVRYTH